VRILAVEVPGAKMVYAEHGEGQPVVCLHGNTGSRRWYERVMEVPGCRLIAPDLPNFGESSALAGPADIGSYAQAAGSFIRALGLERPVLVGHSLGGAVAMSAAVREPGLCSGLVLVDSAPPSGFPTPEERHPLIERMRVDREFLSAALKATVPALNDPGFFSRLVDDAARMAEPAWIGNARALGSFRCTEACAGFLKPVLVIWGRGDAIVSEAMARETVRAFPAARLQIMERVGHSPIVEDPSAFVGALSAFVASLGRAEARANGAQARPRGKGEK